MLTNIFRKNYGLLKRSKTLAGAFFSRTFFHALLMALPSYGEDYSLLNPLQVSSHFKEVIRRVPEFVWIAELAKEYGLKVWLFGGSASSLAHYAKEHRLQGQGQGEFVAEFFTEGQEGGLDYTDIFRPTQDIDLVVDGDMANVRDFERKILERFPGAQGEKSDWEVRTLRVDYGDKQALLDNFDILNQHTDSHSVGLISLDEKAHSKEVVKDLFYWNARHPPFLEDVLKGRLRYYYGHRHRETKRYKQGNNPEIFSVIRYFIKLFQHELTISESDRPYLQRAIRAFDHREMGKGEGYVGRWLHKNVPKLFLHAANVEYAWNVLEEVGLREKLLKIGQKGEKGSPAWWMNKEPLRSFEVGKGKGKTARELGIKTLAHDTSDFLIWTAITRSRKGTANVFKSRQGVAEESATFGDGFYTVKNSREGAKKTGYSVQYTLASHAREGHDFKVHDDMVLVLNRSALKTIPGSFDVGNLQDYFLAIQGQKGQRGYLDKVRMKLDRKYWNLPLSEISVEMEQLIHFLVSEDKFFLWKEWFALKLSSRYPQIVRDILNRPDKKMHGLLMVAKYVLSQKHWGNHPEWVEYLLTKGGQRVLMEVVRNVLSREHWSGHPEFVEQLLAKENQSLYQALAYCVLTKEYWKGHPEWIEEMVAKGDEGTLGSIAKNIFSMRYWRDHPELVAQVLAKGGQGVLWALAYSVLSKEHWKGHPEWVEEIIERGDSYVLRALASHVFSKKHWQGHPQLLERLIARADYFVLWEIATCVFSKKHWKDHPELVKKLIERGNDFVLMAVARSTLSQKHWKDSPELLEEVMARGSGTTLSVLERHVFTKSYWREHARLLEIAGGKEATLENLARAMEIKLTCPL